MIARALTASLALSLSAAAALPQDEAPETRGVAASSNAFACQLYHALSAAKGNLFLSPYSISSALAMCRVGARGETAEQMDAVLHLGGIDPAQGHSRLAEALQPETIQEGWGAEAREVPAYQLEIANALWGQQGLRFEPPFLQTLKRTFGAPLERIDFRNSAAARARINRWVEEHTRKRIRDIVPPGLPTPDTRLALANAIFFKAPWREPFSERWTKKAPFTTAGGERVEAPLMYQVERFRYAATPTVQILELPYRGRQAAMLIALPRTADGLAALEAELAPETLAAWLGALSWKRVALKLPRFSFTRFHDLTTTLPALGMRRAFDPQNADFSGMTRQEPLFIGRVLHKAFVGVDEKGTEAAAATVVMAELGAAPDRSEPIDFTVDHPFLFLIRHAETGCVLFLGRVVDPTEN